MSAHSSPTDEGYARPELLAEPEWLWEHRDDPKVRIIDCASLDKYERAHIPGAVGLPIHVWIKATEQGVHVMGPEPFSALMCELGVSKDTTVVTYDDFNSSFATRLWWVLNYYGHTRAKVLNGGWRRWVLEGRPVSFQQHTPPPGQFMARPNEDIICRLGYLMNKLDDPGVRVVNALPEPLYRGAENPFGNRRVGHIPGSCNLPIERFLTDDERCVYKPAAELRAIVQRAGLSPDTETIIHCQAGVRTTVGFFILSLLGWGRVRAYDAAMAEWANRDDTPLQTS